MIVVDESIHDPLIVDDIARWYKGQVRSILQLRLGTVVKDDAVAMLLYLVNQPTFITINVSDFWHKIPPDPRYCIVAFSIEQRRALEVSELLRRFLRLPQFRTKAFRMGKLIHVTLTYIEYYGIDGQHFTLAWP